MAAAAPPLAIPIRRLRATLRAVVRAVEDRQERVVLTRHGRPVAALVPVGALEALDLLARLLPEPAVVAGGLRPPGSVGAGDETWDTPAEIRPPGVSVPSPLPRAVLTTRPSRLSRLSDPQGGRA